MEVSYLNDPSVLGPNLKNNANISYAAFYDQ